MNSIYQTEFSRISYKSVKAHVDLSRLLYVDYNCADRSFAIEVTMWFQLLENPITLYFIKNRNHYVWKNHETYLIGITPEYDFKEKDFVVNIEEIKNTLLYKDFFTAYNNLINAWIHIKKLSYQEV